MTSEMTTTHDIVFSNRSKTTATNFLLYGCTDLVFAPYSWIDILTGKIASLKSTFGELDAFLNQVVEEHKSMKSDDEHPKDRDFVDILLHLQKNGMLDFELTHDNLKAILLVSFSHSLTQTHF
uniref:Cytochrome P450 n=1 Tax=Quercus lobata TaxID=97700 RepID=A0A7N2MNZ4_QUELO